MYTSTNSGMSSDIATAYQRLQLQLLSSSSYTHAERCERSLDELLRHPDRQGDPTKIANAAYGNAGKVVRSRLNYQVSFSADTEVIPDCEGEAGYNRILMNIYCDSLWGSSREGTICGMLMDGFDAGDIAVSLGLKLAHIHVLVSRVRQNNRNAE